MTETFSLREIEDVFHHAVSLREADRSCFLERACAGRADLRAQVERLLEADTPTASEECLSTIELRDAIGRWNLVEVIGAGGVGVVYRGICEADGVQLQAAVKILHAGLQVLLHQRFIQERSILVRLDHPYIARFIDAGAGPCGTSFLAVEFVEGLPLDRYLEQRRPMVDSLRQFAKICEAVAYLHDNGIVHGDLKPSNVMVKDDGTPKLLDFGTARLIDRRDESSGTFTRWMVTPGYAAPEQMSGLGPSPRADVYSLGCVLREMMPEQALPRDVAAIVDKCLAVHPQARYESPRQIGADVSRYLMQMPVRARAGSVGYVAGKFVRRNRVVCAVALMALVVLPVAGIVSLHQALRARHYAEQRQSLVGRLVRDEPVDRSPESRERKAYAAGLEDAIAQMERMQPPPLGELASAWRRVSYSQASRGATAQSLVSIERSIGWGRRNRGHADTAEARGELAESLLYAALIQKRRSNQTAAGQYALEGIGLVDTLAPPKREAMERTIFFVRALPAAARAQASAGDLAAGRALLVRAVDVGRAMGKSMHFRALLDLIAFEHMAKEEGRVQSLCEEARMLDMSGRRLARFCGGENPALMDDSALAHETGVLEKQLLLDPERYSVRRRLARLYLKQAVAAEARADTVRARRQLEQARVMATALLKADPENQKLQRLMANVERAAMRLAVMSKKTEALSHIRTPQPIVTDVDDHRMEAAVEPAEKGIQVTVPRPD